MPTTGADAASGRIQPDPSRRPPPDAPPSPSAAGRPQRSFVLSGGRADFRYFPDKREVLFAGSERLPAAVRDAVLAADESAPPLAATLSALTDVGTLLAEHVAHAAERRAVIDASAELTERERTKLAAVTAAIREALEHRGAEPGGAKVVAQVATVIFENAFGQWIDAHGHEEFASCLHAVADSLRDTLT